MQVWWGERKRATVKVYRELEIKGQQDVLQSVITSIEQHLSNGWSRDRDAELAVKGATPSLMYCFACAHSPTLPPSRLWLILEQSGNLYVSNIVPLQQGQLSYDHYNNVLEDFYQRSIVPATAGINAQSIPPAQSERSTRGWIKKPLLCCANSPAQPTSQPAQLIQTIDGVGMRFGRRSPAPRAARHYAVKTLVGRMRGLAGRSSDRPGT